MIMKVALFMSMSVNGMVARENNEEDFLSDKNWKTFVRLAKEYGCFVIGRKTYEVVQSLYKDYNFDDVKAKKIVVTKNKRFVAKDCIIASSPLDAIKKAEKEGFKKILLTGGSTINSAFMKAGLVDEIILNVEPVVLGKGIKLFADENFETRLRPIRTTKLPEGIVQHIYEVIQ
jgi:dihydrofolate reductase